MDSKTAPLTHWSCMPLAWCLSPGGSAKDGRV